MKLLVLADLHLDLYYSEGLDPFGKVPKSQLQSVSHCILAGDLSDNGRKRWPAYLRWIAEQVPGAEIYILPGNHDYYGGEIDAEDKLKAVAATNGATYLQKSELIFGRQRFLCTTLWSDFEVYGDRVDNVRYAAKHMNDYSSIRIREAGYTKLKPVHTATIHADQRAWLDGRLADGFHGQTTVITHHAPHVSALTGTPSYGPCYASDLEALILAYQPERWIYGHTHHRIEFNVGRTVLANVSIGYPRQMEPVTDLHSFTFELDE